MWYLGPNHVSDTWARLRGSWLAAGRGGGRVWLTAARCRRAVRPCQAGSPLGASINQRPSAPPISPRNLRPADDHCTALTAANLAGICQSQTPTLRLLEESVIFQQSPP